MSTASSKGASFVTKAAFEYVVDDTAAAAGGRAAGADAETTGKTRTERLAEVGIKQLPPAMKKLWDAPVRAQLRPLVTVSCARGIIDVGARKLPI